MQTNFSGLPFDLFYLLEFTQKDKTNIKSIIKELMVNYLSLKGEASNTFIELVAKQLFL